MSLDVKVEHLTFHHVIEVEGDTAIGIDRLHRRALRSQGRHGVPWGAVRDAFAEMTTSGVSGSASTTRERVIPTA
jgi:hypothetical protein